MAKSRDAFRTISEVADWLDTPAHVLRFWESKFTQIKPVKRAGGRRYYRPGDIDLLAGIKKLLHDDGMTIKGVQKILREQGVRHVSGLAETSAGPSDSADNLIEDAPYIDVTDEDPIDTVVSFTRDIDAPSEPEQVNLFAEPEPSKSEDIEAFDSSADVAQPTEDPAENHAPEAVEETPESLSIDAPLNEVAGSSAPIETPITQDKSVEPETTHTSEFEAQEQDSEPPEDLPEPVPEDHSPALEAQNTEPQDASQTPPTEAADGDGFDAETSSPENSEPIPVPPDQADSDIAQVAEQEDADQEYVEPLLPADPPLTVQGVHSEDASPQETEDASPQEAISPEADLPAAEPPTQPLGNLPEGPDLAEPADEQSLQESEDPETGPAEQFDDAAQDGAVDAQAATPPEASEHSAPDQTDVQEPVEEPIPLASEEPEPAPIPMQTETEETPISEVKPIQPEPIPEISTADPEPMIPEGAVPEPSDAVPVDHDHQSPAHHVDPIDTSQTEVVTRPLVLPNFQSGAALVEEEDAQTAGSGPLGLLANISNLTPDQATALAGHMASLRAVQQRLSQPLQ